MTDVDLLAVARRVAGDARPGEQVEAYVLRSRDTDVEVFDGEVESLTVAEVEGVGIRVDRRRTARATRGRVRSTPTSSPRRWRRRATTPASARPTSAYGLASPVRRRRSSAAADARSVARRRSLSVPTDDKVAHRARARSRGAGRRPAHPQRRVGALRRRARSRRRSRTRSGSRRRRAAPPRRARRSRWPARTRSRRPGTGSRSGARFADLDLARAGARRGRARACGCSAPSRSRRAACPIVLDPLVTRSVLALLGGAFNGESMLKGRSLFVGREGEAVGAPGDHAGRRPDARRGVRRGDARRRRRPHAADRADRRRSLRRGSCTTCTPAKRAGAGAGTTGSAVRGGFKSTPGVGARALRLVPGRARRRGDPGVGRPRPLRAVGERSALRHEPDQRRLLGRRGRPHGPQRRVRRAGPRGHDRVDAPAHAARHHRGRRRPHVAPRRRSPA